MILALPAVLIALRFVPESRDRNAPKSLDWLGTLLAFAGLGMLVAGLIWTPGLGWGDPIVIGLLSIGTLLLVAFVWQQPTPWSRWFRQLFFARATSPGLIYSRFFSTPL